MRPMVNFAAITFLALCQTLTLLLAFALPSFTNDEALACELAGHFSLGIDERGAAVQYFVNSHKKYSEWGAIAKANNLMELLLCIESAVVDISPDFSSPANVEQGDKKQQRKRGAEYSGKRT